MNIRLDSIQPGVETVRVMVVDDHELVRDGLKTLLSSQPDLTLVGEAATGSEAIRRVGYDAPDVVVLDIDLPDGSGIDVCRRIRQLSPRTSVLMLTAYADAAAVVASRGAGAAGFALKRVRDLELVSAIRTVAAGGEAFGDAPTAGDEGDPVLSRLTPREQAILELIAEGMTNREIAESMFLAEKTVKNYVSNLLAKMGIGHRSGAAAYLARRRALSRHPYPPGEWPSPR